MAQDFTYVGDQESITLRGVTFPRGQAVTVEEESLAEKISNLPYFEAGEVEVNLLPEQPESNQAIGVDVDALIEENSTLMARVFELEAQVSLLKAEEDPNLQIPHPGAPKPDDYIDTPEQFAGDSIPTLGEGVLPPNWRDEHWKTKQGWCRQLLGIEVSNKEEAERYLDEALKS